MSGAIDAVVGIGSEIVSGVTSFVTDLGTEFISGFDSITSSISSGFDSITSSFNIPTGDIVGFNGYERIGSFAGDKGWFDTFNSGSIVDSAARVVGGTGTGFISTVTEFARDANSAISAFNQVAPLVGAVSSALGIQDPIAQITQPLNQLAGVAGTAAGFAGTARGVLNELSDADTNSLIRRNVTPGLINSLVDTAARTTGQFTSYFNSVTGTWSVFNNLTNTTVQSGLTQSQAAAIDQQLGITAGATLANAADFGFVDEDEDPFERERLAILATLEEPVSLEGFEDGTNARALVDQARQQQSVRELRNNKAQSSDWRVRLRLAPNSTYLYNAPGNPGDPASGPGIMAPLRDTDGVIFPYTPAIDTAYKANYDAYDLTHSNYRGLFYKNSYVDAINVRAQFTAQDTKEADYLLAVIHFFRSATKMFYGKDQQAGAPPPLVYLNGYGDFQFSEHPCVINQFTYNLPPDVDYIRAQNALDVNTSMLGNRIRNPIANNPLAYTVNRLLNSGLLPGAMDFRPNIANNLPVGNPTYVPTKMEISITLLPIQSRQQVSKNFSVKSFASGNLLKGGYW